MFTGPPVGSVSPLGTPLCGPNNPFLSPCGVAGAGAYQPLLLTDGSVLVFDESITFTGYTDVWKLTPDKFGSYVKGTWTQVASLPPDYQPADRASAVLADGRVIVEGGEFNFVDNIWTAQGAIYDPVANTWTSVNPPPFFQPSPVYNPVQFVGLTIGDAQSVVLQDGTFMLQNCCNFNSALLDLKTLNWTETGFGKFDGNDEEGWTLLPNGKVLTVDTYTLSSNPLGPYSLLTGLNHQGYPRQPFPASPTGSELYDPKTGTWSSAGSTIQPLSDPVFHEIGPALLRPDGTVFALGTHGNSSIYNSKTGMWSVGPSLPISPAGFQCTMGDAPSALLPNGNVLIACGGGPVDNSLGGISDPPVYNYEFDGKKFILEPSIPNGPNDLAPLMSMLVLPTGQILMTDTTLDVEIYTPNDTSYKSEWAPKITSAPYIVKRGSHSNRIDGVLFNGMSQACAYGDDSQCASNYPLLRITNLKTGHVFYSRTHDHSFMGVASKRPVHTYFDVPKNQELGKSKLEVVANGIPSKAVIIEVKAKDDYDLNHDGDHH